MEGISKKPLDEIMSFFGGNPLTTPVGQKIGTNAFNLAHSLGKGSMVYLLTNVV